MIAIGCATMYPVTAVNFLNKQTVDLKGKERRVSRETKRVNAMTL